MKRYRVRTDPETGEAYLPVASRGAAVTNDPILNKGTAFPEDERVELGLLGVLPPTASSIEQQLERVYENYRREPDDLARYLYLVALQDRNETLFYRLLLEHLEEMAPIVYTPTVGMACERFSHVYRRARGLYVTADDVGRMRQVCGNAPFHDVAVIVATDGEGVLGIGDQGAGGISIAIGKLVLYTLGAGIHPARCLPVMLDVGTNNPGLRRDPLYLGVEAPRLQGDDYLAVVDAFVEAVGETWPRVLLQWEDFSRQKAWTVLDRYRDRICSFNDDIEGTGAVTLAGVLVYCAATGRPLRDQRFCIHGTGAGGGGILEVLEAGLMDEGLSRSEARERLVGTDSRGLILSDRPGLESFKRRFARDPGLVAGWDVQGDRIGLEEIVREFEPTVLIGTSGQPGCFHEGIVRQMADHCERPAIFALSNPTSKTEVLPQDALDWSEGRAYVVTGSPFPPAEHDGRKVPIGQGNNVFCFPGIGLGVMASGARRVSDEMLLAAARGVAEQVSEGDRSAGRLYPAISGLRWIERNVAQRVAQAALDSGAVPDGEAEELTPEELGNRIDAETWYPDYVTYRAVGGRE